MGNWDDSSLSFFVQGNYNSTDVNVYLVLSKCLESGRYETHVRSWAEGGRAVSIDVYLTPEKVGVGIWLVA